VRLTECGSASLLQQPGDSQYVEYEDTRQYADCVEVNIFRYLPRVDGEELREPCNTECYGESGKQHGECVQETLN